MLPHKKSAPAPQLKLVRIDELTAYPASARRHSSKQIEKLAKLLRHYGQVLPVLVAPDFQIIDGHAVVQAMRAVGFDEVFVHIITDRSTPEIKALRLAINRIGQATSWDRGALEVELEGLRALSFDTPIIGFSRSLRLPPNASASGGIDAPVSEPAVCRAGDIWTLDDHFVIVGTRIMPNLALQNAKVSAVMLACSHWGQSTDALDVALSDLEEILPLSGIVVLSTNCARLDDLLLATKRHSLKLAHIGFWKIKPGQSHFRDFPLIAAFHNGIEAKRKSPMSDGRRALGDRDVIREFSRRSQSILVDPLLFHAATSLGRRAICIAPNPDDADVCIRQWQQASGCSAVKQCTAERYEDNAQQRGL